MIILLPEKTFRKKITKWVKYKDFLIADATDRHDGTMKEYGNVVDADELNPTPTLNLIAQDPDSKEARIKKKRLHTYLDNWLQDESTNIKIHYLVSCILKNYDAMEEDLNLFVVMRNTSFYAYKDALIEKINSDYGVDVATFLTHKMEKSAAKEVLQAPISADFIKTLRKSAKKIRKILNIEKSIEED